MRCGDCVFWKRNTDKFIPDYMGDCSCPKFVYTGREDNYPRDGLEYCDYECYSAGFRTGEDFGCVHFKAKGDDAE